MTCAKVVVRATLTLKSGEVVTGENWCGNPQQFCPREPGEGYAKCRWICNQPNHAEGDAVRQALDAGFDLLGSTMHVTHKRICGDCQKILDAFGIEATHE